MGKKLGAELLLPKCLPDAEAARAERMPDETVRPTERTTSVQFLNQIRIR
jgi:hypothetical protein